MEKNIKDYLHLYLGCEVEITDNKQNQFTGILTPTDLSDLNMGVIAIKPILRPLSDIKGVEYDIWASFTPDYSKFDGRFAEMEVDAKRTAFLLSKHFDLFDLIPAGLAIDKTTL